MWGLLSLVPNFLGDCTLCRNRLSEAVLHSSKISSHHARLRDLSLHFTSRRAFCSFTLAILWTMRLFCSSGLFRQLTHLDILLWRAANISSSLGILWSMGFVPLCSGDHKCPWRLVRGCCSARSNFSF